MSRPFGSKNRPKNVDQSAQLAVAELQSLEDAPKIALNVPEGPIEALPDDSGKLAQPDAAIVLNTIVGPEIELELDGLEVDKPRAVVTMPVLQTPKPPRSSKPKSLPSDGGKPQQRRWNWMKRSR